MLNCFLVLYIKKYIFRGNELYIDCFIQLFIKPVVIAGGARGQFVLRLNTSSVTMIICGLVEKSTVVVTKQHFDFWHAIGLREDVCK